MKKVVLLFVGASALFLFGFVYNTARFDVYGVGNYDKYDKIKIFTIYKGKPLSEICDTALRDDVPFKTGMSMKDKTVIRDDGVYLFVNPHTHFLVLLRDGAYSKMKSVDDL